MIFSKPFVVLSVPLMMVIGCAKENPVPVILPEPSRIMHQDQFENEEFVVYANGTLGTMQAYSTSASDGTHLEFELMPGAFPSVMNDQEGNEWNIYGIAVKGPRLGQQLKVMNTLMGYWFSFAAMYPEVTIFGEEERPDLGLSSPDPQWLIDPSSVYVGTFRDGIKSIDAPKFDLFHTNVKNDNYINENELVITYFDGEDIRVYPHKVLDWHEVINENSNLGSSVVSYCPLTGTASVWKSEVDGQELTFGVSGLLYNSNLILYDRQTESIWSQMRQLSVYGQNISKVPETIPYVEMTWEGARQLDIQLKVLTQETGQVRNYDTYPYGDYRTNNDQINFPINVEDDRVPAKERVLAVIINERVKVYRFEHFE